MSDAQDAIAGALGELEKAKRVLAGIRTTQVRKAEHRQFFQAVALSWFRSRRVILIGKANAADLDLVDVAYRVVIDASERAATKKTYKDGLRDAKDALIRVRGAILSGAAQPTTTDSPPDFAALVGDTTMQGVLSRRWAECRRCIDAEAPLAATVMMGGLLEALLVARANRLTDKSVLFKTRSCPIDPKTRKPLDLRQWMLAAYIDVAHELGWITRSAKDIAIVLRDYRNYVHPEKERAHGITLTPEDAKMFWELSKLLSRQVLTMAPGAADG